MPISDTLCVTCMCFYAFVNIHIYIYIYIYKHNYRYKLCDLIVWLCIIICNVCDTMFIVPTPLVKIIIFDNYDISGDDTSGQSGDSILRNLTIGDPLTLDCTVTAVRGISSSVDIIWTTGGRVVRRVDNITADIENDYAIYTDSFEISSLSAIDNGREYQCTVVINASQPIYNSDQITLSFRSKWMS